MHRFNIVVGAQWGDEGKGKWIDQLAPQTDVVVRYQGGNNAGHTIQVGTRDFVFHHLPSGILHDHIISALASGVVINPVTLCKEMKDLQPVLPVTTDRFWISAKAHVITPWHIHMDHQREHNRNSSIGTTKRGIGPTYADRSARIGCSMGTFVDDDKRTQWLDSYIKHTPDSAHMFQHQSQQWTDTAHILKDHVCNVEQRIRQALREGKRVLCEGAQGTLLDLTHGTYPYVTSSNTIAASALTSIGVGTREAPHVIGIAKAYCTRVGEGPFPTELFDACRETLAKKGKERGATTSRQRRCGWLDGIALRYACEINSFDELFLNKLDVLSEDFSHIKFCTAYDHPRLGRIHDFPNDDPDLASVTPIYETFAGWGKLTAQSRIQELPASTQAFIRRVEEFCQTTITRIGTGPERNAFLTV